MNEKKIYCQFNEELSVSELKKKINPKNRNKHPKEQIERLAKILLKNGVRHPIVISNLSGLITKGHGRLEAAILNGWSSYPVQFQDYENQEQEFADAIADNAIASWAELDLENIQVDLKDLSSDFDIDLMGIDNFSLETKNSISINEKFLDENLETQNRCPSCDYVW
jgi:hypothetical protein